MPCFRRALPSGEGWEGDKLSQSMHHVVIQTPHNPQRPYNNRHQNHTREYKRQYIIDALLSTHI